jgi:Asp-tRNA(Asn)/Glu-tRNA(Gln) amidotransferase A subunit family amidase
VDRWGVVSYADSLDCVGVLGTDVVIVKRVFGELTHYLIVSSRGLIVFPRQDIEF